MHRLALVAIGTLFTSLAQATPPASPPKPPSLDLSISAPAVRRDVADAAPVVDEFRARIQQRVAADSAGLRGCYDRRLKVDPTLQGRWQVSFTVSVAGAPTSISARGLEREDAELEACIVAHIERNWQFGPIPEAWTVSRTLALTN